MKKLRWILVLMISLIAFTNLAQENTPITLNYPQGTLNDVAGNPLYQWNDVGATKYVVYLAPQDALFAPLYFDEITASRICDDGVCKVDLTTYRIRAWLANRSYEFWICPVMSGSLCDQVTDWHGPFHFSVNMQAPSLPIIKAPTYVAEGYLDLNWQLDGSVDSWGGLTTTNVEDFPEQPARSSWTRIWFGYKKTDACNQINYIPIIDEWHDVRQICDADGNCHIRVDFGRGFSSDPVSPVGEICNPDNIGVAVPTSQPTCAIPGPSGCCGDGPNPYRTYELYVQSWGPGGFSVGGIENTGWVGPYQVQPSLIIPEGDFDVRSSCMVGPPGS